MSKTLTAGQHEKSVTGGVELVFTRRVNDRMAENSKFTKFVYQSIIRFNRADWGNVKSLDWEANNVALESLNSGDSFGRILATYRYTKGVCLNCYEDCHRITIWILRNTAKPDGTQVITVLFPDEY